MHVVAGLVRRCLHASVRRACLEQKHHMKTALSGSQGRQGFCDFLRSSGGETMVGKQFESASVFRAAHRKPMPLVVRRQYGTVLAGWRNMDLDRKGYLCFLEFCQSCREMLFDGDVRSLWRELACQQDFITLKETGLQLFASMLV